LPGRAEQRTDDRISPCPPAPQCHSE
jgi:hypothetical protein